MRIRPFLWPLLIGPLACTKGPDRPPPPEAPAVPGLPAPLAFQSPLGGDTLVEGRTYTIRWSAPAGMRINLGAAMGGKDKGLLLAGGSGGADSLAWTVPEGFVTSFEQL